MLARKVCSLLLAVSLIVVLAVPVMAADEDSAWVELLEFSSVNDTGQYIFSFTKSGTMNIPLPQQMRIRKVDMLISTPSGEQPISVSVTANSQTFDLTINKIASDLIRVSGYVPNTLYSTLIVKFQKSTSTRTYYQILSCKVSGMGMQEYQASADVRIENVTYSTNQHIDLTGVTPDEHAATSYQARINVYDWEKFDQLSVWGSVDGASIDSIRATLGTAGLPMETNFYQYNDAGTWTEYVFETDPSHDYALESGASLSTPFYGKYLYCITIDLSNVDRTSTEPIYVYMTGHYDTMYGASYNCQYVNGSVYVADTSSMTWWKRFTSFMTGLFEGDSQDAEDFQQDAAQKGEEMDDLNNQFQDTTKPSVDDIPTDLDGYVPQTDIAEVKSSFSLITQNSLFSTFLMMGLTVALIAYILYGKR